MHIAIIGAGALGAVYGVRLALVAKQDVTFVVRAARAQQNAPLEIQRIDGDAAPTRSKNRITRRSFQRTQT